eukprot:265451-Pelagomonas_calceolata.AAC.1
MERASQATQKKACSTEASESLSKLKSFNIEPLEGLEEVGFEAGLQQQTPRHFVLMSVAFPWSVTTAASKLASR